MGILAQMYRRCQLLRHKPASFRLRPGTIDRRLFRDVVIRNEYRLPQRFHSRDVILDVGAHIGAFGYAALRRGAGQVFCCEPDAGNFRLLEKNLRRYSAKTQLLNRIVWRSDVFVADLPFGNPGDPRNTGAGSVVDVGGRVPVLPFDALIDQASTGGKRRICLVKLDCEGAEWPILFTSRKLDLVDAICGEYHIGSFPASHRVTGLGPISSVMLEQYLVARGFQVALQPVTQPLEQTALTELGLFFAVR